jgi:hypothetical protein
MRQLIYDSDATLVLHESALPEWAPTDTEVNLLAKAAPLVRQVVRAEAALHNIISLAKETLNYAVSSDFDVVSAQQADVKRRKIANEQHRLLVQFAPLQLPPPPMFLPCDPIQRVAEFPADLWPAILRGSVFLFYRIRLTCKSLQTNENFIMPPEAIMAALVDEFARCKGNVENDKPLLPIYSYTSNYKRSYYGQLESLLSSADFTVGDATSFHTALARHYLYYRLLRHIELDVPARVLKVSAISSTVCVPFSSSRVYFGV